MLTLRVEKKNKLSGLLRINLILSALLQGFPIYMLVMPTLPTHTHKLISFGITPLLNKLYHSQPPDWLVGPFNITFSAETQRFLMIPPIFEKKLVCNDGMEVSHKLILRVDMYEMH